MDLRKKMGADFAPVYAERSVLLSHGVSRRLVATTYCPDGDLVSYANSKKVRENLAEEAYGVFLKFAETLLRIQDAGAIWTDTKTTNILVDKGELKTSDVKAFYNTEDQICNEYQPLHTKNNIAPEIYTEILNAESTHAYILGLNLHLFINSQRLLGAKENPDASTFTYYKTDNMDPRIDELNELTLKNACP